MRLSLKGSVCVYDLQTVQQNTTTRNIIFLPRDVIEACKMRVHPVFTFVIYHHHLWHEKYEKLTISQKFLFFYCLKCSKLRDEIYFYFSLFIFFSCKKIVKCPRNWTQQGCFPQWHLRVIIVCTICCVFYMCVEMRKIIKIMIILCVSI
jgi:hypothetical protein